MNLLTATLRRDLRLGLRRKSQVIMAPAFFMMMVVLFPMALGPDSTVMKDVAPGLLMVAALLAALLPLDTLFRDDFHDGSLDLLTLSPSPLALYALGKTAAYWLLTSLPLLLVLPVLLPVLGLSPALLLPALAVFIPVTMLLNLTGAVGAALSLGTRPGSVLLALLLIPFYIPVLIFGAAALGLLAQGMDASMPVTMLWAGLAVTLPAAPLAAAAILKGCRE
jgi:heme exporter protein B